MKYVIYGPYTVPRKYNYNIDGSKLAQKRFWDKVKSQVDVLDEACGCYVFAINNKPFYVGKTNRSFAKECFTARNVLIYQNAADLGLKGKPRLFFIAKQTKTGKFAKSAGNGHQDIKFLETLFIGMALEKNSDLQNINETKRLRKMVVPGFLNSPQGQPSKAVQSLKKVLKSK